MNPDIQSMSIKEFEIPVPWGHVSVKAWGNQSGFPVMVLHGIQDNCGSFDPLIPLLPSSFYYLCIDLPGHGKSSHFPPGSPLNFLAYVYTVKVVADYLRWKKFTMMAHSLGGHITVFFCSLYPELVDKAILIDGILPKFVDVKELTTRLRSYFDGLSKINEVLATKSPPSYTYEEALTKIINHRGTNLNREAAEALLKRSLVPSGNGFRYSIDQRLRLSLLSFFSFEQTEHILSTLKCPVLAIIAKDSIVLMDKSKLSKLSPMKPNLNFVVVEGNHDVHMKNPLIVFPYVRDFLLQPGKSSL